MPKHWTAFPRSGIVFTYIDNKGIETNFCISELLKDSRYQALEVHYTAVLDHPAEMIGRNYGLEKHRLARVLSAVKAGIEVEPVTFAHKGGWDYLIDGAHRYYAYWCARRKEIPIKVAPPELWNDYVMLGIPKSDPDELKNSFSGLS